MTPLELRILTSAVTAPAPLGYYLGEMLTLLGDLGGVPEPVIRTRFVAAIGRLFREQYLIAERIDNDGLATGEYFYPTSAEIEAGLRREISFDYQLTPRGSSLWEEQAQPNWSHYICNSWKHGDKLQQRTLAGMQETLVKIGVLLDAPCIIPGTLHWTVLAPWQVTYWKRLPIGYQASYQLVPDKSPLILGAVTSPPLWPPCWYQE